MEIHYVIKNAPKKQQFEIWDGFFVVGFSEFIAKK